MIITPDTNNSSSSKSQWTNQILVCLSSVVKSTEQNCPCTSTSHHNILNKIYCSDSPHSWTSGRGGCCQRPRRPPRSSRPRHQSGRRCCGLSASGLRPPTSRPRCQTWPCDPGGHWRRGHWTWRISWHCSGAQPSPRTLRKIITCLNTNVRLVKIHLFCILRMWTTWPWCQVCSLLTDVGRVTVSLITWCLVVTGTALWLLAWGTTTKWIFRALLTQLRARTHARSTHGAPAEETEHFEAGFVSTECPQ